MPYSGWLEAEGIDRDQCGSICLLLLLLKYLCHGRSGWPGVIHSSATASCTTARRTVLSKTPDFLTLQDFCLLNLVHKNYSWWMQYYLKLKGKVFCVIFTIRFVWNFMPCLGRTRMPSSCSRNGPDRPTQHAPLLSKVLMCNNVLCGVCLTQTQKYTKTYVSYETTFCEWDAKICTVWEKEWYILLTSKLQGTGILLSNTHGAPKTATQATKTCISVFSICLATGVAPSQPYWPPELASVQLGLWLASDLGCLVV